MGLDSSASCSKSALGWSTTIRGISVRAVLVMMPYDTVLLSTGSTRSSNLCSSRPLQLCRLPTPRSSIRLANWLFHLHFADWRHQSLSTLLRLSAATTTIADQVEYDVDKTPDLG